MAPIAYSTLLYLGLVQSVLARVASNTVNGNNRATADDIQYCGSLDTPAFETTGDEESGPGFWITNHDSTPDVKYFLYENSRDDHPWKYLSLSQGATAFVSVCATWQGRVVRGTPATNLDGGAHNLGTWFQSNLGPGGWMWGEVSFLEGCDGGGAVAATDGSGLARGCVADDLLSGAPDSALALKYAAAAAAAAAAGKKNTNTNTHTRVLGKLVGDAPNGAARDWELKVCSPAQVWIDAGDDGPVIMSANGRLNFTFYKGTT